MARDRSSRSAERPRATMHVAAIAVAFLAYMLIPVVHAGHHWLERGPAIAGLDGDGASRGNGCTHHACRGELPVPGDTPEPTDNRHDHSSCEICQLLYAARKHIDLSNPEVAVAPSPERFVALAPAPREIIVRPGSLPRSTRGPPLDA